MNKSKKKGMALLVCICGIFLFSSIAVCAAGTREPNESNSYGKAWFQNYYKGKQADVLLETNYAYGCSVKVEFVNHKRIGSSYKQYKCPYTNSSTYMKKIGIETCNNKYFGQDSYYYDYTEFSGGAYRFSFTQKFNGSNRVITE